MVQMGCYTARQLAIILNYIIHTHDYQITYIYSTTITVIFVAVADVNIDNGGAILQTTSL